MTLRERALVLVVTDCLKAGKTFAGTLLMVFLMYCRCKREGLRNLLIKYLAVGPVHIGLERRGGTIAGLWKHNARCGRQCTGKDLHFQHRAETEETSLRGRECEMQRVVLRAAPSVT
jgi:hypothetical protein